MTQEQHNYVVTVSYGEHVKGFPLFEEAEKLFAEVRDFFVACFAASPTGLATYTVGCTSCGWNLPLGQQAVDEALAAKVAMLAKIFNGTPRALVGETALEQVAYYLATEVVGNAKRFMGSRVRVVSVSGDALATVLEVLMDLFNQQPAPSPGVTPDELEWEEFQEEAALRRALDEEFPDTADIDAWIAEMAAEVDEPGGVPWEDWEDEETQN